MSKEETNSPDTAGAPIVVVPGNRRALKSRPRNPAKLAKKKPSAKQAPAAAKSSSQFPVFDQADPAPSNETAESSSAGGDTPQENPKRKRRRKKGKGGGSQNLLQPAAAETPVEVVEESLSGGENSAPSPSKQPRSKADPAGVAKLARKIYLAEVSEEGVALIGDSDAKELSRRCFRLAEIFMEELARQS